MRQSLHIEYLENMFKSVSSDGDAAVDGRIQAEVIAAEFAVN